MHSRGRLGHSRLEVRRARLKCLLMLMAGGAGTLGRQSKFWNGKVVTLSWAWVRARRGRGDHYRGGSPHVTVGGLMHPPDDMFFTLLFRDPLPGDRNGGCGERY